MNERFYSKFVLIFSIILLLISLLPILGMFLKVKPESDLLNIFLRFGWLISLLVSIFSPFLYRPMKLYKIRILTVKFFELTIAFSIIWTILTILSLLCRGHVR